MSEIVAETNGMQGIIIADTMVTEMEGGGQIVGQWEERKIYGTHFGKMIHACAGTADLGMDMVDELEKRKNIFIEDLYKIYDEQLIKWQKQGIDASDSVVFTMYKALDKVRIAYCTKNKEKNVYELANQKMVIAPSDTHYPTYLSKVDTDNILSKKHLEELIREFIAISEKSQYVSDTCCIATMNHWGVIGYYEDNMYKMLENIRKNNMKSDISILAQSTPAFIRAGVQKAIPEYATRSSD